MAMAEILKPFDLETWPFQPGRLVPKPVAVGCEKLYRWEDWNGFDNESRYVGAFIPFDLACVCEYRPGGLQAVFEGLERQRFSDIIVREQLIDIAKGIGTSRKYSLAEIAKRRLGKHVEKDDTPRLEYWRVDRKHPDEWPDEFRVYLQTDLDIPLEIYHDQEKDPNFKNKDWEGFETHVSFVLYLISSWGIRADSAHVRRLLDDAGRKYSQLLNRFREAGVLRDDGTRDKRALEALVTKAYNGNPPRTEKGNVSTDKVTLAESGDQVLQELTGDGPITKIVTTYGKVLEEACQHPYNARYNVLVSSGRTSGNFQQWPRGGNGAPDEVNRLRASFVPRPGFVYCSCDVTAAELGSLAQVCYSILGWSKLRDAINGGQDLHSRLAARFLGITYEEALKKKKSGDSLFKNLRQAAKPVNFGLPGLMGARRLVAAAQKDGAHFCVLSGYATSCKGTKCKKCLNLAYEYIRLWKLEWPEVPEYHRWIEGRNLDSFVSPISGFIRGSLFPSEASNHPFQHLTSRGTKLGLIYCGDAMYRDVGSPLYGSRMVAFFHDEIFAEVPVLKMNEAGWELARILREAVAISTPDVKVTVEPALMDRWYKAAETVVDKEGRLQIWRPE